MDTTWENEARAAQNNLEKHCDGQAKRHAQHAAKEQPSWKQIVATITPTQNKKEGSKAKSSKQLKMEYTWIISCSVNVSGFDR